MRPRERFSNALRQHLGHLQNRTDIRIGFQHTIGNNGLPELVVADKPRPILRHLVLQNGLDLVPQRDQRTALLGEDEPFECPDVIRVHREKPNIFVHALVHGPVKFGEGCQVGSDLVLLVGSLLEQSFCDHETDVLAREKHLRKAVLHAP